MTCKAGRYDRRVSLRGEPTTSQGAGGAITETVNVIGEVWAKVEPMSARSILSYSKLNYPVTHKITMRYSASAALARFIMLGTRTFKVTGVRNLDEANRDLEFMAYEGTPV